MGIFDKIKDAIWGRAEAAPAPADSPAGQAPTVTPASPKTASAGASPAPAAKPAAGSAPAQPVDVAAILDAAVKKNGQKLNWRTSIVDLMKALDLDSSLSNRKELAQELGYTGDTGDSAAMNMWLHKQVVQKLKDNGGKVPADLT